MEFKICQECGKKIFKKEWEDRVYKKIGWSRIKFCGPKCANDYHNKLKKAKCRRCGNPCYQEGRLCRSCYLRGKNRSPSSLKRRS